ncbi:YkgJ family cysteine cluster protein [Nonlabens antarcticus]|uniref:YkgJ family cysteine cluster protein n=1 Tax=Nonlabens antarcticus TaxID=392714 RepID=UPI001890DC86|nr:hypothetical protein [Nonlabens antarcticus]
MSDDLSICLSCGLCCDGTVIGFVELNDEEKPSIKKLMDIEDEGGNGFFLQPCDKFCDGCTIYEDRPKHCGTFKCGLLKSVEQNELDFNVAVDMVHEIKQKKRVIEEQVTTQQWQLTSPSFYFRMIELKKILDENHEASNLSKDHFELLKNLNELELLLLKNFEVSLF